MKAKQTRDKHHHVMSVDVCAPRRTLQLPFGPQRQKPANLSITRQTANELCVLHVSEIKLNQ